MAKRRHPVFPEHGLRCRHEAWILTRETGSARSHENRACSFEHSPVAWNSFEKQNSVGQTATRRQAYALPFSLGEDRLMWTIVLAKSATSHERPESELPRHLPCLDVPLP